MRQLGPYKSPDELGITPEEHAGLIAVMEYLRGPQVVHAPIPRDDFSEVEIADELYPHLSFNMSLAAEAAPRDNPFNCGCAACIGGHLSLVLQGVSLDVASSVGVTGEQLETSRNYVAGKCFGVLYQLFFPFDLCADRWPLIKSDTAADAVESLLDSGRVDWRGAAVANGQADLLWGGA